MSTRWSACCGIRSAREIGRDESRRYRSRWSENRLAKFDRDGSGYRSTMAESTNRAVSNEAISIHRRPVETSGRPNMAVFGKRWVGGIRDLFGPEGHPGKTKPTKLNYNYLLAKRHLR